MAQILKITVHRLCVISSLLFITIGCDQTTKILARDFLPVTGPLSYLNDSVRLEIAHNPGAFLSLGAELSGPARFWIFNVAVGLLLLGVGWALWRQVSNRLRPTVGLTLILGGGIGNLMDRFLFGSVTDFLILGWGPVRTGIINVADMAIVLGVMLLAWPIRVREINRRFN